MPLMVSIIPECPTYTPEREKIAWEKFRDTYKVLDRFVGEVIKNCADENTLIIVLSDHGGIIQEK